MRASVEGVRDGRAVIGERGGPVRAAGRGSARAGRATTTGSHTGARAASREEKTAGRKERGWPSARRIYVSLRAFCLGAIAYLSREVEAGSEIPFAFDGHGSPGRPTLYEYRPLVREFVAARVGRIAALPDAHSALEELRRSRPRRSSPARTRARATATRWWRPSCCLCWRRPPRRRRGGPGRRGLRTGVCGARAVDVRVAAPLRRRCARRRVVARRARRPRGRHPDPGGGGRRAHGSARGRCVARTGRFGREPDRLCVLELEHELAGGLSSFPTRRASWATR